MSTADYQRKWRASKGAQTGEPGRRVTQPCGTVSAYKRHQRHGEIPCAECKTAWASWHRDRYQSRGFTDET